MKQQLLPPFPERFVTRSEQASQHYLPSSPSSRIWLLIFICVTLFRVTCNAQPPYTSVYNSISYSSVRPYNLNVVYFVPKDVPLDPTYQTRLSAIMLATQEFYRKNMESNGYGSKTFGLFTETANPQNVKLLLIRGEENISSYPAADYTKVNNEVTAFFNNNPAQKASEHILIITAVPGLNPAPDVPFYGIGRTCFALDYPDFDMQHYGQNTSLGNAFTSWFGGLVHELAHGLNVGHSRETNTEFADPNKGTSLMYSGNHILGKAPVFLNRAACAVLNNCQVLADAPGETYYNGHTACLTDIKAEFIGGNMVVSGSFQATPAVTDVNIYQDPYITPSQGYHKIAWSVAPTGNRFSVSMPISEVRKTDGPTNLVGPNGFFNLQIELVLKNGETNLRYFPFWYFNGTSTYNLNLTFGPSILTQPTAQVTSTGVPATFSVVASGPDLTFRWQFWDGTSWNDIPAGSTTVEPLWTIVSTAEVLQVTPGKNNNIQKVRVIVGNGCPVTSSEASLSVTTPCPTKLLDLSIRKI